MSLGNDYFVELEDRCAECIDGWNGLTREKQLEILERESNIQYGEEPDIDDITAFKRDREWREE